MRVVASLRKRLVLTFVICLIILLVMPSTSFARREARYELVTPDFSFGNDIGQASDTQNLFHQQTLQTFDNESLNINFPVFANLSGGIGALGPTAVSIPGIASASANVLPFGPVDLAFPSIGQTVNQSVKETSTGFFSATFLGLPPVNTGAPLVWSGPFAPISSVTAPPRIAGPNMPFPEMVDTTPGTDRATALAKTSNSNTNSGSIPLNTVKK